jgi:hypothetical protein
MRVMQRFIVISLGFYALAIALGIGVVRYSIEQSHDLKHAAELSTFTNKVTSVATNAGKTALKWGFSWLWLKSPVTEGGDYEHAIQLAGQHGRQALNCAVLLGLATAGFVAFLRLGVLKAMPAGTQLAVRHLCWTSLVLFGVGVGATALSLIAFKDMPLIGQVVFKFESKGIAQTIIKLFSSGNAVLGGLIFLFSIAVPFGKVALTLFATYTHGPKHDKAMKIIKAVGKWSMADVFVIAVLLAFLAMGGDEFTDAWVGPGVYFFAAYCILSMWAGVWLAHPPVSDVPHHD